jgi:hypothetical protein
MLNICITHKDRNNYLRVTLATLREACRGHDDVRIYLYNDGSTLPLPEIVHEMENVEVIDIAGQYKLHDGDAAQRYNYVLRETFERSGATHVFITDSDAAFHPQVISVIKDMIATLPDIGIGSVFNAVNHRDDTPTDDARYVHKLLVGLFCTVISRTAWEKYGINISKGFDHGLCGGIRGDSIMKIYCTQRSYVEHIGHSGIHNRGNPDSPDYIDRAKRFFE